MPPSLSVSEASMTTASAATPNFSSIAGCCGSPTPDIWSNKALIGSSCPMILLRLCCALKMARVTVCSRVPGFGRPGTHVSSSSVVVGGPTLLTLLLLLLLLLLLTLLLPMREEREERTELAPALPAVIRELAPLTRVLSTG